MAPLNEEETNCHVAVEEIDRRRNSWLSYFFNMESNNIHQRKSDIASNISKMLVTENESGDKIQDSQTLNKDCMNENKKTKDMSNQRDSEIKGACKDTDISAIQKQSPCENCKIEWKKNDQVSVYKKIDSDRASKQSNFRAAVMDLSPEWFKSFMRDPEFVMEGGKRAKHNE